MPTPDIRAVADALRRAGMNSTEPMDEIADLSLADLDFEQSVSVTGTTAVFHFQDDEHEYTVAMVAGPIPPSRLHEFLNAHLDKQ